MMRHATAAAMLALVSGCAQMEWLKPDMEPATRDQDLARCEQEAHASAARMSASQGALIPGGTAGPGGAASIRMPPQQASRDLVMESDLLTSCMHAKGYRLGRGTSAGAH